MSNGFIWLRIFCLMVILCFISISGKILDKNGVARIQLPGMLSCRWGRILRVLIVSFLSSAINPIFDDQFLSNFTSVTLTTYVVVFSVMNCLFITFFCLFAFQDMTKKEIAISASIVCIYYALVFLLKKLVHMPDTLEFILFWPILVYDTTDWLLFRYSQAPIYVRFGCVFLPLIFPVCARSSINSERGGH